VAEPRPCSLAIGVLVGVVGLGCTGAGPTLAADPASPTPPAPPIVGGPCRYTAHPGKARIVSVRPKLDDAGVRRYDVRFEFLPDGPIAESFAQPQGRTFALLASGSRPDDAFLARHGIRRGQVLPCTMKIIASGTCTPVMFEFAFDREVDAAQGTTRPSTSESWNRGR